MTLAWWLGGIAAVVLLWLLIVYNTLVSKRNAVKNAESGVDVQLKKRFELDERVRIHELPFRYLLVQSHSCC